MIAENNSDRWTPEEEERLRHLMEANSSPSEIAEGLGRTVSAVKAKAHSLGLSTARFGLRRRSLAKWG
jgi:hypothetical protein